MLGLPIFDNSSRTGALSETPYRGRIFALYAAVAVALVLSIVAFFTVSSRDQSATAVNPSQSAPALTVTSIAPRRSTWSTVLTASGTIAPWQEASISTQIGNYQLIDVLANVGDRVKKGHVLARFDPALLKADEMQLEANYDQAEANRQRAVDLKSNGNISEQAALQITTQAKVASALLASKRLQLRYTEVVAPDDGTISARMATLGAVVPAGQELFRLIRQNRLEWRGELTAIQLARIETGQLILLSLPGGASASASVRQIAPALDSQSRLGVVYADIEPGSPARAGMYASGEIVLGDKPVLAVPAESVVIRDGRDYVLKLDDVGATSNVLLQAVTVGRREGEEIEILSGLSEMDRIVAEGAGFLNHGDVVRIADSPTPGGSAVENSEFGRDARPTP